MWLILIIVVVIGVILLCKPKIEGYGGPLKRIHRIPKNQCYALCGQTYRRCMEENQYINAGTCDSLYKNCVAVCNYSDFQRL